MDGEQPTFIFELQKELDAIRENFRATASPDVVTAMDRSAEELIRAGIVERALQVGSPAPDFALPNAVGREVRLSSVTARGPSVITFYRGAW
ncbi:alkyl hydroperoxide reductase/ Thiol specific antioxidant/ Mal allergen [Geobacter metallireducens RCH3]|nr:alkyl hydroperoxide reductase/ Thiol specific antioxidant/ Mal allergen [Geobacter metallireducens RCH3]